MILPFREQKRRPKGGWKGEVFYLAAFTAAVAFCGCITWSSTDRNTPLDTETSAETLENNTFNSQEAMQETEVSTGSIMAEGSTFQHKRSTCPRVWVPKKPQDDPGEKLCRRMLGMYYMYFWIDLVFLRWCQALLSVVDAIQSSTLGLLGCCVLMMPATCSCILIICLFSWWKNVRSSRNICYLLFTLRQRCVAKFLAENGASKTKEMVENGAVLRVKRTTLWRILEVHVVEDEQCGPASALCMVHSDGQLWLCCT